MPGDPSNGGVLRGCPQPVLNSSEIQLYSYLPNFIDPDNLDNYTPDITDKLDVNNNDKAKNINAKDITRECI